MSQIKILFHVVFPVTGSALSRQSVSQEINTYDKNHVEIVGKMLQYPGHDKAHG